MIYPPSKTEHTATKYIYLAYYPPIISLFILMISSIIHSYLQKNNYMFYTSIIVFPFIYTSFVVWVYLILDYMLCIINRYGSDSLLNFNQNNDDRYVPANIPESNNSNESVL